MKKLKALIARIKKRISLKAFLRHNHLKSLKELWFKEGEEVHIEIWDLFSGIVKIVHINDTDMDIEVVDVGMCYPSMQQAETGERFNICADDIYSICCIEDAFEEGKGFKFTLPTSENYENYATWEDVPF